MVKEKENIIKNYNQKRKLLEKHNKLYYNNDNPIITDSKYDKLKVQLLSLEKKYNFLGKKKSVTSLIGSTPSNKFEKIKHLRPMLSLSNAFN